MRNDWKRKQTQVVWADLEAWQQQLYDDHSMRVSIAIVLPIPGDRVAPAVCVELRPRGAKPDSAPAHRDWRPINPEWSGHAEQMALQMVSAMLLELEREQERAERQRPLPF